MNDNSTILTLFYIGYVGRAPDPDGFDFWMRALESGSSLADVAKIFALEPEAVSLNLKSESVQSQNPRSLLNDIFLNIFGRDGDNAGLDFWVAVYEGGLPVDQIMFEIISAAQGSDILAIDNKAAVATQFLDIARKDPDFELTPEIIERSRSSLKLVTADATTVFIVDGPNDITKLDTTALSEALKETTLTQSSTDFPKINQVTASEINDAPVAVADVASTSEETLVNIDILVNDTDADGDVMTVTKATALNGAVVIKADGTLDYTPTQNFNGNDTITYIVSDPAGLTSTAQIVIAVSAVNDAPVAVADVASTSEDTLVNIDVLGNDTDLDGDVLTVTTATTQNGTVTVNVDKTLNYTPNTNFAGADTITYTIADAAGLTSTADVTVTVSAVNDAPVAVADTATTLEDTPLVNIDVLGNDSDVDGDALTVITATAQNGSVTINGDKTFNYTPNTNFAGADTITYTIADAAGLTSTAVVTVTVLAVNKVNGTEAAENPLNGSDGIDFIKGNGGADHIFGLLGDDTLNGGVGADQIFGGAGNDTITGDAGADIIDGGSGNDTISGGAGVDNIDGGSENDIITGDAGADNIDGGSGNDIITGDAGADIINGGSGNDIITGDADADIINGGSGNDTLTGGDAADILDGGAGIDILTGGAAADKYIVTSGLGDIIADFVTASDTISFGSGAGSVLNYREDSAAAEFSTAKIAAEIAFDGIIIYSVQQVGSDVYVFVDNDNDNVTDISVKLAGVTLAGVSATDIIA
ncbi:MAG: Ca2+-binding RTX toxin-like protein [Alteromonas macleodii]